MLSTLWTIAPSSTHSMVNKSSYDAKYSWTTHAHLSIVGCQCLSLHLHLMWKKKTLK
jgi:hypothetical protein